MRVLNTELEAVSPGPRRQWCSDLSLLHHKVEAAQSLSGSQMSDLQTSKQAEEMQPGGGEMGAQTGGAAGDELLSLGP